MAVFELAIKQFSIHEWLTTVDILDLSTLLLVSGIKCPYNNLTQITMLQLLLNMHITMIIQTLRTFYGVNLKMITNSVLPFF